MADESFRFGEFAFTPTQRRLARGGRPVAISSRYLDALNLLIREHGSLVTKQRFLEEVWRGVPVTDEALTQCIRALRQQLGDDVANPKYIETVPKHGYRFIAPVERVKSDKLKHDPSENFSASIVRTATISALAGAVAGVGGGLFYGLGASPAPETQGFGAASMLMVMLALNVGVGLIGGLGVGTGIALATRVTFDKWQVPTGAGMLGGLAIGGLAKLIGLDVFSFLFGWSPTAMTGPAEGGLLGAALGFAAWLGKRGSLTVEKSAAVGGLGGGLAGFLVPLLGGHLLGGSLNALLQQFPDAKFRLDRIGTLGGESGFGQMSELISATVEGALFGFCVVGGLAIARRQNRGDISAIS